MGRRGPVPVPDNVRVLRGARPLKDSAGRKVRRLVLPPKAPAAPSGLSAAAAAEWRRVVPQLARAGVLAEVDRGVLSAYCQAWGWMQDAARRLRAEGVTTTDSDGNVRKHPAWQVWRESQNAMIAAGRELYVTPVARLRLPVSQGAAAIADDDGDDDPFD